MDINVPHINVLNTKPRSMKELPHSVVAFRQVKIGGDLKIIISSLRKGKEKSEKWRGSLKKEECSIIDVTLCVLQKGTDRSRQCFRIHNAWPSYLKNLHIYNGNRFEWSPIRSVMIPVRNKTRQPRMGVWVVNHEYDYRQNWTTRSPFTN